ncbi:MAG: pyruvate dehydrogenase complex dihydrolipoamide acetyltransferase [Myxococcales bacterium]
MAKIIGLPKLSPTMEEGTLVRWVKQEGEPVEVDDLIAEVETDKATMEFRSFDKGVLLKQLAPEGATLQPDQPVAIFGKQGDDIQALLAKAGGAASAPPAAPSKAPASDAQASPAQAPAASQAAAPAASEAGAEPEPASTGRVLASPVVRKIAREREIDLHQVRGTGPNGRVIKRDVEGFPAAASGEGRVGLPGTPLRGPSAPPPTGAQRLPPPPAVPKAPQAPAAAPVQLAGRTEKLSQMRKTIARRLTESKQTVPHFYLTIDVDAEPLVRVRGELNERLAASGEKISLNDLVIKASAVALRLFPRANASFLGDSIVYHDRVDISVAVAVPDGLLTPVVRGADRLGVLAISQTVRELAARAKDKKLKPEEMQNGTFSISNLGMYGIDEFSAVINPPEGAILAVGAVRDEPVLKQGSVVAGKRMKLTMSCDHRVVDGAVGAEWLKVLRGLLESPASMLL